MSARSWIVVVGIVLVVIAGFMFLVGPEDEETEAVRVPEPPAPIPGPPRSDRRDATSDDDTASAGADTPAVPEPEPIPLPELGQSDAWVRARADDVAEDDALEPLLAADQLVRRMVVVIENLGQGEIPRGPLSPLAPEKDFPAIEENGRILLDPAGYERFDRVATMVEKVDPQVAVTLLRRIDPLLQSAYAELGIQEADVDQRLVAAIDVLLETPIRRGEIELVHPTVAYEFADPELEALPRAQKQLIRMGPENARRVLEKLRDVRSLLLD